jgi:Amt family ammonium transporter
MDPTSPALSAGDTAWMLCATALVLFMTLPGLALFYGGMVRKKNVLGTLAQSFAICCLASVLWVLVGYSLAFSAGSPFLGGFGKALLSGVGVDALQGSIPEVLFAAYQLTFAVITPALVTGAFAERLRFSALLLWSGLWLLLVYAPVCHGVWAPGGFLFDDGVLDFAGGTVVHINAGVAGLVAALVTGRRRGHGREHLAPHNLVLTVTGASMLWVGWFGFNAGSALAANGRAAMALLVTHLAAAAAALAWMGVEWTLRGKPSVLGIVSGAVGGLVAITPGAGFVGPGGALAIGLLSGAACWWGASWLKVRLGYDDSLDCFGVHGIGGLLGALLTGVFARQAIGGVPGLLDGNPRQLLLQAWGVLVTIAYAGAATWVLLKIVDKLVGLRVDEDSEREGLDIALHGEAIS